MTANFLQTDGKGRQMAGTLSLKRPGKDPLCLRRRGQQPAGRQRIDLEPASIMTWPEIELADRHIAVGSAFVAQPRSRPDRPNRAQRAKNVVVRSRPRMPAGPNLER
jgi:hypothetical protein